MHGTQSRFNSDIEMVRAGKLTIDVFVTYLTNPLVEGVPFLDLPEEVNQSNPSMQDWYASASYTNPHGQTFRGTYAAYAGTIPMAAANPTPAEAFVRLLLSEREMTMFERAGFFIGSKSCALQGTSQRCRSRFKRW
jgi:ABC-type molybdate transport system substrate-binding protein